MKQEIKYNSDGKYFWDMESKEQLSNMLDDLFIEPVNTPNYSSYQEVFMKHDKDFEIERVKYESHQSVVLPEIYKNIENLKSHEMGSISLFSLFMIIVFYLGVDFTNRYLGNGFYFLAFASFIYWGLYGNVLPSKKWIELQKKKKQML